MQDALKKGLAHYSEGKLDEAETCFQGMLNANPHDKEASNNLGVIAIQRHNYESAYEYLTRSLKLDPYYKSAMFNLVTLLDRMDLKHAAVPFLVKCKEKHPQDLELRQLCCEAERALADEKATIESLYQNGHIEQALKRSTDLIGRIPDDSELINDYAVLNFEAGKVDAARQAIGKARRLAPQSQDISDNQAIINQGCDPDKVQGLGVARSAEAVPAKGLDAAENIEPAGGSGPENVLVMEFLYHWNYFITSVDILKRNHNVFLIIGEGFKKNLVQNYHFDLDAHEHLVLEDLDWDKINRFIVENHISKIFINTIQGPDLTRHFSQNNLPAPFYITIHNFDLWFGARPLFANDQDCTVDAANKAYHNDCMEIMQKCAGLIAIDESLRDSTARMIEGKDVYVMPWNINRELISMEEKPARDDIVFTIPASIDCIRRNYGVALETFSQLAATYDRFKLVLLGRPIGDYGKRIIDRSKAINSEHNREVIEFFDSYIHQDIYDQKLRDTDYFILPITNLQSYGKFKASAAMQDAMVTGRPIIVPQGMFFSYNFCSKFGDGFIVYKDLGLTIKEILGSRDESMQRIHMAAVANANYYHIDNQVDLVQRQFF